MMSFSDLVQRSAATAWLFIPSAVVLGALHGLEPGHSKTMMAAFIVAIRGTVWQAVLLAVSATISHTAIVWVVAIAALAYGSQWSAEASEPYFQFASGVIIVVIALWMAFRTYQDQRSTALATGYGAHDERKRIDTGHGVVELSIFEEAVPPRFRVHFVDRSGRTVSPPTDETVTIETARPDGTRHRFAFGRGDGPYLEATETLPEPHEFSAELAIAHGGHAHTYKTRFTEHDHAGHYQPGKGAHGHSHDHGHDAHHGHAKAHRHESPGPGNKLELGDDGAMDAHQRAHATDIQRRFAGRHVTTGQVILFGLTGGLLPCPAAVTVLLLCLQLQRFWLGIVLVLCFSIGLALTLLASGTVAAWGMHHAAKRWPGFDSFARKLPYLSSAVIISMGAYVGWSGWTHLA